MNVLDMLKDKQLLGGLPPFRDLSTWAPWLTFLRALHGMPLNKADRERFCRHTGRSTYSPPKGGFSEAVCIVGRQSGKSRIAGAIAVAEAITAKREADGTELYALLIAQDGRAAVRTLFRYASAPFDVLPMLQRSVTNRTNDTLTLDNGVMLAAYPCRPSAVRGIRARVAICDELAFFRSTENIPVDVEMLRALRPCLATTAGKLIILSSPYAGSGALYELHRNHFGSDASSTLVWQASAPDMNPTLAANYLEKMQQDDPEAYRSEVLGEFRTGLSNLLDPEALAACVVTDRRELPPAESTRYYAFCDPSGGRGDAFTLAIAHGNERRVIVDCVRAWEGKFNPSGVIAEAAALIRSYRLSSVTGDRYAGEFPREAFRSHGVDFRVSELDRSSLYLELLPIVNAGNVELLDDAKALRELRGLERRRGTSGKDRVDHPRGQHDDRANSIAGAVVITHRHSRQHADFTIPDMPKGNSWGARWDRSWEPGGWNRI